MENNNNLLSKLSPKQTFIAGVVGAVLVLFTVGFFILLSFVLRGDGISLGKSPSVNNQPTVVAPPSRGNLPPQQPSGEIRLAAITKEDHIKGNKKAKISVVEFSDTECPFCKRFHPTMQRLIEEYPDDVNWVYRHFPLDSLHPKARLQAEATECAGEQGKFWPYLDRIFEITPSNNGLRDSQLPEIAEYVGLNVGKFQKCLDSGKFAGHVAEDLADAQAAGGNGTPYSVIISGDQKIPVSGAVPYGQLKNIIDSVLE